jgi:hypothetical protein
MSFNVEAHTNRLLDYSRSIRSNQQLIDYVLSRASQLKNTPRASSTLFPLVSPPLGADSKVDWKSLYVSMPEFQESVQKYIRSGYFPLGTIDMNTTACEVFADVVPEAYREDILSYANLLFPVIYETTVRVTAALAEETRSGGESQPKSGGYYLGLPLDEIPSVSSAPDNGGNLASSMLG